MVVPYCPDRGDLVWLTFDPQAGHEQAGRRPALTLSPISYNRKTKLALFCPITSQVKGFAFEVPLPTGLPIRGVVLADQIRNLAWAPRRAEFIVRAPSTTLTDVLAKLGTLLQ